MSNQESAEIKAQINSICAVYKPQHLTSRFMMPVEGWHAAPSPPPLEMNPKYVHLQLAPLEDDLKQDAGSVIMKTEDVKRFNLMVGDTVTVRIIKS
jgi:hypothetical protein